MLYPELRICRSIMPLWYDIIRFKCNSYINILVSYIIPPLMAYYRDNLTLYFNIFVTSADTSEL